MKTEPELCVFIAAFGKELQKGNELIKHLAFVCLQTITKRIWGLEGLEEATAAQLQQERHI